MTLPSLTNTSSTTNLQALSLHREIAMQRATVVIVSFMTIYQSMHHPLAHPVSILSVVRPAIGRLYGQYSYKVHT